VKKKEPRATGAEGSRPSEAPRQYFRLDDRNPSHYAVVITSVFSGALERAIRAAENAIELSPSFALGHLALGFARLNSGRAAEAIGPYEHGLRLNPILPYVFSRSGRFRSWTIAVPKTWYVSL
jgi:tetratricopeptide (TPR) repeat protein